MKCVQLVGRKRYQNSLKEFNAKEKQKFQNKFEEMKFYKKNRASCDCVTMNTIFSFVLHRDYYYYYTILYNAWRQNEWTKYELICRCVILFDYDFVCEFCAMNIYNNYYELLSLLPKFNVQLRRKIELEFIRINTQTQTQTFAIRNCGWEKARVRPFKKS